MSDKKRGSLGWALDVLRASKEKARKQSKSLAVKKLLICGILLGVFAALIVALGSITSDIKLVDPAKQEAMHEWCVEHSETKQDLKRCLDE